MTDFCSNTTPPITIDCKAVRPVTLEERRQLMEREVWIKNVMRILNMTQGQAENTWVRIQVANHNEKVFL